MRNHFRYLVAGHTCDGLITCEDALLGPIVVYPDDECAYTYAAGFSQAGSNAVFLNQQLDGQVEIRQVDAGEVESFLRTFILEWLPDRGNLKSVVTELLSDYLT
jgi:hypothetical protein